ncbi:MAG: sulfite exporter TauE/SafE family protein [Spirochaetaceae bacterium]|jgi:uncharacterized membrane protein YfcA|nr:sulfite exporter TauE/SafE family protein [Spirochaetaceae bacterium]
MRYVLLGLAGLLSGIVSGMGIGGGAVLIPSLAILFGMEQQAAQNINLIYFAPTASAALITHIRNRAVEKRAFWPIVLAGIPCAVAGALIATKIDAGALRRIFGFFLLGVGLSEFFSTKR